MRLASRFLPLACALALAAGCGSSTDPAADGRLVELEAHLVQSESNSSRYECSDGADGWDYVCQFTDETGTEKKVGVIVDDERATKVSEPVALEGKLPAHA